MIENSTFLKHFSSLFSKTSLVTLVGINLFFSVTFSVNLSAQEPDVQKGKSLFYGAKTFAAHKSMIDDVNLAPSAISKYYKNYNPDNKEEVLKIQQDLVDKGFNCFRSR